MVYTQALLNPAAQLAKSANCLSKAGDFGDQGTPSELFACYNPLWLRQRRAQLGA